MIVVKNVFKTYLVGKKKLIALKNINLNINKSEFIAIKGPSGSGKTTLLNLLGALDSPDSGQILFDGNDIAQMNSKERYLFRAQNLGFIFQHFNLIPELTVYENVEIPLLIARKKDRREKVREIVKQVGLLDHIDHKPSELSGGQMQRVSISRALVKNPPLILADEPTANLDSKTAKIIIELMHQLNKEYGTSFIIATHDEMILDNMDRIIYLMDGEIVSMQSDRTLSHKE